jgi:integrase
LVITTNNDYLDNQKQRVLRKEISPGTLKTLWTPIRTFCDAYDDLPPINWKRTSKSMPRFKPYSSDRIPTLEEIRKLCEYPDRRIKAIIYTMASPSIRIGGWGLSQVEACDPHQRRKNWWGSNSSKITSLCRRTRDYFRRKHTFRQWG